MTIARKPKPYYSFDCDARFIDASKTELKKYLAGDTANHFMHVSYQEHLTYTQSIINELEEILAIATNQIKVNQVDENSGDYEQGRLDAWKTLQSELEPLIKKIKNGNK